MKVKNLLSHLQIGGKYFDAYPETPEKDVPEIEKATYLKGEEFTLPEEVALLLKARSVNSIQILEPIRPPKEAIKPIAEEVTMPEEKPKAKPEKKSKE